MEFQVPTNWMFLIGSFLVITMLMSTGCQAAQKDDFLNSHNHWRSKVDPPAANMQKMEWDNDLFTLADRWAKKCIFDHPGTSETDWRGTGQNLYIAGGSGTINVTKAVEKWDSEKKDYNYDATTCSKVCGHYTQVVWATSVKLGCSAYKCSSMTETTLSGPLWNVVCQYKPQGNYRGAKPYVSGKACSSCPASMKYCVNNQCSATGSGTSSTPKPGNGNSAIAHDPRAVFIFIVATLLFTHAF